MPLHQGRVDEEFAFVATTAPKVSAHDTRFAVTSLGDSLQEDPKSHNITTRKGNWHLRGSETE